MNLDACTPRQRESIEHVDGPLLVSAGAGSGKTFTLTQRIAYALLPESGPAVESIDEVLAITFTEKAAAEIKARVKRTLRAEGLVAEALKVDGAWISTIHGMCARILRVHALDLGIDPAFGIMSDAERADALADAIDGALGEDNDIVARSTYTALFDEYKARSNAPNDTSIASMLQNLLDKASTLRGGLDAVDFGPPPACASVLARELLLAYENIQPTLERAGSSATAEKARGQAKEAVSMLQEYLAVPDAEGGEAAGLFDLAGIIDGCARIGGTFKVDAKPAIKEFQAAYDHVAWQVKLGLAHPFAHDLLAFAREVSVRYDEVKRAACKLDNDDLLTMTLQAFEGHPDIARRYENRFKLVMVDEFQDTSQLQIDMIAHLAGSNLAHLCTVGDAQQSIYRFRGADVNVYNAHRSVMGSDEVGALCVQLSKNFRSHADILSFVDCIFGQPHVFGDSFMSLEPHATRVSGYRGSAPRIDLVLALTPGGKGTGVGVADAKLACARSIARRFAALRNDGHAPGDMVVLLGKMSRADVYAEALREVGFECVVTGGSKFASAPEVCVVARFVEALANPSNTAALFEVLTSDMVRLSADDLLALTTEEDPETGELRRRNLDRGCACLALDTDELPDRLVHALRLFERAQHLACTRPVADVVLDTAVRSGWMARLERQGAAGVARAANVLKAVRLIEELESEDSRGLASCARALADELAVGLKEAPGALSGVANDVVRIMTIHASKGLEFPIVALADFAGPAFPAGKLVLETCGSVVRASLAPGASFDAFPQVVKRCKGNPVVEEGADNDAALRYIEEGSPLSASVCSQPAYRAALAQRAAGEELAEARRKLYVGLTRASEALVVAMDAKVPSADNTPTYPALIDDIRSALCGASDFPAGETVLPYGGLAPARFERVLVQASCSSETGDSPSDVTAAPTQFFVPHVPCSSEAPRVPWRPAHAEVFSYSSLARAASTHVASTRPRSHVTDTKGIVELGFLDAMTDEAPLVTPDGVLPAVDADKATGLGSAFHRAAQHEVETGCIPDAACLDALARFHDLSHQQTDRLAVAVDRWFSSTTFTETHAWSSRMAEVPFFTPIGDVFMEGEIDLLCIDASHDDGRSALVIDYKTGGSDDEDPDQVREKHLLQAECYAYALLREGFVSVELRFVRVERAKADGEPQEVRYRFEVQDLDELAARILTIRSHNR